MAVWTTTVLCLFLALCSAQMPTGPTPPGEQAMKEAPAAADDPQDAEENARLMKEWDMHMTDFVPADLVSFEIAPRGHEEFYEVIDDIPSKVRGAFFVSSKETKDIDLVIYDPTKTLVYESRKKKEDLFHFEAARRGQYLFMFTNHKYVEKVQLTFALHTGNSTESVLDKEHLSPVESTLIEVQKSVKDFQMDQQFAQLRQESHYKTVEGANRNVFWFSLLECVGVVGVTCWQVYYVKRILDHRRMI